jgi:hypothetical protein
VGFQARGLDQEAQARGAGQGAWWQGIQERGRFRCRAGQASGLPEPEQGEAPAERGLRARGPLAGQALGQVQDGAGPVRGLVAGLDPLPGRPCPGLGRTGVLEQEVEAGLEPGHVGEDLHLPARLEQGGLLRPQVPAQHQAARGRGLEEPEIHLAHDALVGRQAGVAVEREHLGEAHVRGQLQAAVPVVAPEEVQEPAPGRALGRDPAHEADLVGPRLPGLPGQGRGRAQGGQVGAPLGLGGEGQVEEPAVGRLPEAVQVRVQGPEQAGAGESLQAAQQEPGTQDLHLEEEVRRGLVQVLRQVQFAVRGVQVQDHLPAQAAEGVAQGRGGVDQGQARRH